MQKTLNKTLSSFSNRAASQHKRILSLQSRNTEIHKLPNFVPYARPSKEARKRMFSPNLDFLALAEIEDAAKSYKHFHEKT